MRRTEKHVQRVYDATMFQRRVAYYTSKATQIQRWARGFLTRKYILDIQERRSYLSQTAVAAAKQAEFSRQYNEYCEALEQQARLEAQSKVVQKMARLHHMRSTAARPGVFRPNYPVLEPTIGGKPVDAILKEEARKNARASITRGAPKILDNLRRCVGDV